MISLNLARVLGFVAHPWLLEVESIAVLHPPRKIIMVKSVNVPTTAARHFGFIKGKFMVKSTNVQTECLLDFSRTSLCDRI